jgi:hypothetical protein
MGRSISTSMRRLALALAVTLIATLAATPGAFAGTLEQPFGGSLRFQADAGVANNVTAVATPTTLTISDSADTITTTIPTCSGSGTNKVECSSLGLPPPSKFFSMSIALDEGSPDPNNDTLTVGGSLNVSASGGEGNDTITSTGTGRFEASGDEGNDTVTGGPGNDSVSGDEGVDTVNGGAGHDSVQGGEGNGDVVGGGAGNDLFIAVAGDGNGDVQDGGPGFDQALYLGETEGVPPSYTLNLAAGSASGGGETDTLANVEDATTFQGADTVTGSQGANHIITALDEETILVTLSGVSELQVDAGDTVNPLGGPDFVKTGAGNDIVNLVDGTPDRADCGSGTDTVQADPIDELIDCENVTLTPLVTTAAAAANRTASDAGKPNCTLSGVARSYSRKAFLKGPQPSVSCNEDVELEAQLTTAAPLGGKGSRSRASVSRAGDLVLAEKSFGFAQKHVVRLKPIGRLSSQLGGRFKATIRIVARDRAGNATVLQRTVSVTPDRPKGK